MLRDPAEGLMHAQNRVKYRLGEWAGGKECSQAGHSRTWLEYSSQTVDGWTVG